MNLSLRGHRVLPDGKMPRDPEGLVMLIQRAMPFEMFDPDEHAQETTVRLLVDKSVFFRCRCGTVSARRRVLFWLRARARAFFFFSCGSLHLLIIVPELTITKISNIYIYMYVCIRKGYHKYVAVSLSLVFGMILGIASHSVLVLLVYQVGP